MKAGEVYDSNKWGQMKVLKYESAGKVLVEFIDTGYTKYAEACNIRRGGVKDMLAPSVWGVGYLGEGAYTRGHKGNRVWDDMLRRCYDTKTQGRYPTYSVAKEWHNFQAFAKWFDDHYIDGYELDKDIKVPGNKVYGPSTCMFVTHTENIVAAVAKSYNILFNGKEVEVYNLLKFCRENGLKYQRVHYSVTKGKKVVDVKKYLV